MWGVCVGVYACVRDPDYQVLILMTFSDHEAIRAAKIARANWL